MEIDKREFAEQFNDLKSEGVIVRSLQSFKIKLFLEKAVNSLQIAKFIRELEPSPGLPKKLHWNYWAITISYYSMLYAAKAAILSKGYEVKSHDAAQVALGHLLVPSSIEREDLELLEQAHKIFEDEYVKYFEDARKESHTARYTPIKTYTERQLEELYENARRFVEKVTAILI
jgi:uncharacterized protein (UPF0332 family)